MEEKILGSKDNPFTRGWTICASSFDPEKANEEQAAINDCKLFVKRHGLTSEDVKIIKEANCILVVTKREVSLS